MGTPSKDLPPSQSPEKRAMDRAWVALVKVALTFGQATTHAKIEADRRALASAATDYATAQAEWFRSVLAGGA